MLIRSDAICVLTRLAIVAVLLPPLTCLQPDPHISCTTARHRHDEEPDQPARVDDKQDMRTSGAAILAVLRHTPDDAVVENNKRDEAFVTLNVDDPTLHRKFDHRLLRILAAKRARHAKRMGGKGCRGDRVCRRIKRMQRRRRRMERRKLQEAKRDHRNRGWKRTRDSKEKPTITSSSDLLRSNRPPVVITKASHLRRDWCRTDPLKQRVFEPGCRPKIIMNNFCYGQCNSFYIPKPSQDVVSDDRSNNGTAAFQSCAFCKPIKNAWTTVTLSCPGLIPPYRTKLVQRIQKCRCQLEILR